MQDFLLETIELIPVQELKMDVQKFESYKECYEAVKFFIGKYEKLVSLHRDIVMKALDAINAAVKKVGKDNTKELTATSKILTDGISSINDAYSSMNEGNTTDFGSVWRAYQTFKALSKKFNIKYSDEVMEEKLKFYEELNNMYYKILELGDPWFFKCQKNSEGKIIAITNNGALINDFAKAWKACNAVDKTGLCQLIAKNYNAICSNYYNELWYTVGDVSFAIKNLKLEKANTFIYKLINKAFKSDKFNAELEEGYDYTADIDAGVFNEESEETAADTAYGDKDDPYSQYAEEDKGKIDANYDYTADMDKED